MPSLTLGAAEESWIRRAFVSPAEGCRSRRDTQVVHITHHVHSSKAALCQRAQELSFRRNLDPGIPPPSLPPANILLLHLVAMSLQDW